MIQILINNQPAELPPGATVAEALAQWQPRPPFAVAVNTQFVPKGRYAAQQLQAGDKLEIIAPVTGG
ncbi:MAG: sulfur carrier protein ThiS [Comamonas sp.]